MGEKGEGSGVEGGGKWGRRGREVGGKGRELGMGYPPVHPLRSADFEILRGETVNCVFGLNEECPKRISCGPYSSDGPIWLLFHKIYCCAVTVEKKST